MKNYYVLGGLIIIAILLYIWNKKRNCEIYVHHFSMIDHCSFMVKNYDESIIFYDETLKILGYERLKNVSIAQPNSNEKLQFAGYGKKGVIEPSLWISNNTEYAGEEIGKAAGLHIAFVAPDVEAINAWHKKCIELGGKDNGAPAPRSYYHPGYYGAFIVDPNGWRIEASINDYKA